MNGKKNVALLLAGCLLVAGCSSKASSSASAVSSGSAAPASSAVQVPQSSSAAAMPEPSAEPASSWEQGYLPQFADPESGTPIVTLHTSMGDIKMMLFPQAAPKTVESFVTHCKNGYYDGVIFHRVIEDFVVQGGDPGGTGLGGESAFGGALPDEFSDNLHNFRGAVSMANSGYGTSGSQFFIVQQDPAQHPESSFRVTEKNYDEMMSRIMGNSAYYKGIMKINAKAASGVSREELQAYIDQLNVELRDTLSAGLTEEVRARFDAAMKQYMTVGGTPHLDYKHTVFGQVLEGMDVVDAIARVEKDAKNKPKSAVVIQSTTVETAK